MVSTTAGHFSRHAIGAAETYDIYLEYSIPLGMCTYVLKRVISHISGELQDRFCIDLGVMRVVVAFCPFSSDFINSKLLNSVSER